MQQKLPCIRLNEVADLWQAGTDPENQGKDNQADDGQEGR